MKQRPRLAGAILAISISVPALVGSATAQDKALPLSDCLAAVGTFLTSNKDTGDSGTFVSRSLISFTNGGHTFFTDSDADGGAGFSPFSDGRGAWRCMGAADGVLTLQAVIVDFTYQNQENAKQQIGRLDIEAVFDSKADELAGRMGLSFVPLDGNPMKVEDLKRVAEATFTGYKIAAE